MKADDLKARNFESEFIFSSSRSSGPGGQNVNKVNSKVELRFSVKLSSQLTESEKELIYSKLKNKINLEGELILVSQSERTQLMNKYTVINKFYEIINKALSIPIKRKPTSPTHSSKLKRLEKKRIRSFIKKMRKNTGDLKNEH